MGFLGIGGSKKVPGIDAGALNAINEQTRGRSKQIIGGLNPSLAPLSQQYEQKRNTLGEQLLPQAEQQLTKLGQDMSGIGGLEKQQGQQMATNFREQQFRQVPEQTRQIREAIGSTGLGGNARALGGIAAPTLQAATAARDLESQLSQQQLQNEIGRKEGLATTGFATRGAALEQKFGLDTDTVNYLTSIGREDLIREASDLVGTEEQYGANAIGIEQARQADAIARAQAKNAKNAGLLGSIGSLAGAGIGAMTGNPLAIGLGSQLGGQLGGMAGGGQGQAFDPSLLFLMQQQKAGQQAGNLRTGLRGGPNVAPNQYARLGY